MAQNYTLMARKNLLKPNETPKFYAVARSGRKVTVKEVCKRITERSSYSKGELEGCIGEFLLEIVNVLEEGNIVQMGDLGNFRMSIKTGTPTDTVKEFKASCIDKGKVLFYPGSDLRKLCKTLDYTLYKSDSSADSDRINCLMMVTTIKEAPAAEKLRTRRQNQPVVDWFLSL